MEKKYKSIPNNKEALGHSKLKPNQKEIWRPKSLEKKDSHLNCPFCSAPIMPGYAICPACGRSLTPEKCSFCGAAIKSTAKFCGKCGQPREGLTCPECGTLNARNFCRKCNTPLTPRALKAIETAKNDPQFQKIKKKAAELAELHSQIVEMQQQLQEDNTSLQLSEEDKKLLDEYAEVLGSIGAFVPKQKVSPQQEQKTESKKYQGPSAFSLDEIMKAYKEKAAEMYAQLAQLVPPPDFTPEEQRDYYSARKIAHFEDAIDLADYSPTMWVCNYCGCMHHCPSECAEPELGGTWLYVSPEEYAEANPWAVTHNAKLIIE